MGASSSGLLDEPKISHIKDLVDSMLKSFSEFYHQQYSSAYFRHLHQEVEPKKEGQGVLLKQRPQYAPEEVLYQGSVKLSCWYEQGKKCKDRYIILRRDYKVEIHENKENFDRRCAVRLVLQPTGGSVLTTEEESRAHLEQMCAEILNGVKEDSSSVAPCPDGFPVYLHLPNAGQTCFLFKQGEERDHFLSALNTCIRHCNLDPWCESTYESQAFIRALRLYRQEEGCYESWEMLQGTEEEVLAAQMMQKALPWLQSQLQSRVKGKRADRIQQWLATVHATNTLVLERLTASLEALREKCRQTAVANQALIRSDLDQIVSSLCFLEQKVKVCICEEAEGVCSEFIAPYIPSILEVLSENINAGIQGMQNILHTQMDSAITQTHGRTEETKKALLTLRTLSLDQCYIKVKNLTQLHDDLKQRFGLSGTQRLVHSAHLEMEQLFDNAVYTLELFLQSLAGLQPSEIPVKMESAKERVLKQLDYDSRFVQRKLYQEALLEITLPILSRRLDGKWKSELQQFEQYIYSDYSSFILVHNVYDNVLRNILSAEIERVLQDAARRKSNNLLLDISDLAISVYSLLEKMPLCSAPGSPAIHARHTSSSDGPGLEGGSAAAVAVTAYPQNDPRPETEAKSEPGTTQSSDQSMEQSPEIVMMQEFDEPVTAEIHKDDRLGADTPSTTDSATADLGKPDPSATPDSPELTVCTLTQVPADYTQRDESAATQNSLDSSSVPPSCPSTPHPSCTDISLVSLNKHSEGRPAAVAVTAHTQNDPRPEAEAKSDPATTQSLDQSMGPLSPEIFMMQEFDIPATAEIHADDRRGAEIPSTTDSATADPSTNALPGSPEPSASTGVLADCAQRDESATIQNSPDSVSVQPSCDSPPHPPCTDSLTHICLLSLNKEISCKTATDYLMQTTTNRAVYIRGQIKDSWEAERVNEGKRREAEAEVKWVGEEDEGCKLEKITGEEEEEAKEDGYGNDGEEEDAASET